MVRTHVLTPYQAAETTLHSAVRDCYVALAKHMPDIAVAAIYLEELSTVFILRPDGLGAWALTLEQTLGKDAPATVRQALTQVAHCCAILAALDVDNDPED